MLILADSGILLRLFDPIDSLHATIDAAVRALRTRGDKLVYSLQNAAEFWNVCTRPAIARGGLGLDLAETQYRLVLIERGFTLIAEPAGLYPIWRQLVVAHSVRGKQVHDARLVALMQAHGITHILTLNAADFTRYPGIIAIDPASVAATLIPPTP
jgi:predicted nucleic acid-binding protein